MFLPTSALLLGGCNSHREPGVQEVSLKDDLLVFLDSLESEYERACRATGLANWNSYTGDSGGLDSAKQLLTRILLDSAARRTVKQWSARTGSLADPLLSRRLEMWNRCFTGGAIYADPEISALENSLQGLIAGFKPVYDGKKTTRAAIDEKLRRSRDRSVRRQLWRSRAPLSAEAAEPLGRLVAMRNAKARSMGFSDYYSLALSLQSIDEAWLLETLDYMEQATREPYLEFLAEAESKAGALKPWDFDFALNRKPVLPDRLFPADSVFNIIHSFESALGFRIDSLPILERVLDLPYGGLSLGISIPDDSRFIVKPSAGQAFYRTALHEYGHSLKAVHISVVHPILKGYEWVPGAQCAAYEEGVAELHGEFTSDPEWLARYTSASPESIERALSDVSMSELYRVRRLLRDFHVEYAMYKQPGRDPAEVEREMTERYLLTSPGDEPHHYAGNIWYTAYPCYFQNYILGGMISAQLFEAMTDKFGPDRLSDPGVSAWMIAQLYGPGESKEWAERIRQATGKSLETGPYLRKLGIDSGRLPDSTDTTDTTNKMLLPS